MKAASVVVLALTLSLAVAALTGCGAAPQLARSGADKGAAIVNAALDADDAPPQLAPSILSVSRGPSADTLVFGRVGGVKGGSVLVGGFIVSCGIMMEQGPFATDVHADDEGGGFSVVVPAVIENLHTLGAFVDVDEDGAFDANVDVVLSADGYAGLDVDGDGRVELNVLGEDDWLRDTIPALLLEATTTVVE